jgi:hypothetical protein
MKVLAVILIVLMGLLVVLAAALILILLRKGGTPTTVMAENPEMEPENEPDPSDEPTHPVNQRRHVRVAYPDGEQPMLKVRKHQLPVADISEKGLCFLNTPNIKLGKWVRGEMTLQTGETLVVEGQIVRELNGAFGLSLITPIPYKTIIAEERAVHIGKNANPRLSQRNYN